MPFSCGGSLTAGDVEMKTSTATVQGPIVADALTVAYGTLSGPSDWTIGSSFNWSSGMLSGGGQTTLGSGVTTTMGSS